MATKVKPRQQSLFDDLPRAQRKQVLRDLVLPDGRHGAAMVAGGTLCRVLEQVESFADEANGSRCWASRRRIAERSRCSVRTVGRSLLVLERWGLLLRINDPKHLNATVIYQVDYNKAKQLIANPMERDPMADIDIEPDTEIEVEIEADWDLKTGGQVDTNRGHGVTPPRDTMSLPQGHHVPAPRDTMSLPQGHHVPQILKELKENQTTTKEPTPESVVVVSLEDWKKAEAALIQIGVNQVAACRDHARFRGLTAGDVLEIVTEAQNASDSPGIVFNRIRAGYRPRRALATNVGPLSLTETQRQRRDRDQCESIRNRIRSEAKHARRAGKEISELGILRAIYRRLTADGLADLATDAERAASHVAASPNLTTRDGSFSARIRKAMAVEV